MTTKSGPPSSWSVAQLSAWLMQSGRIDPEAVDALALCDVDGRMFLEMDEEDLAESEELGLDMKSLQIILQYQQDFEALELAYHGHSPREKATSVGTINISSKSLGMEGITATPRPSGGVRSCPSWSIPCVSVDKEGNSYFSEKSVILSVGTPSGIGALSTLMPAVGLKFRETPAIYDLDFHTAPARQFVVSLDAGVEIEVTDGTRRTFAAGAVVLMEDTWGKGHRSRAVDGQQRKSLFVIVPDDFSLSS